MSGDDRMIVILRERERLIAQCDFQREELATLAQGFQRTASIADRIIRVVKYLRAHPLIAAGGIALIAVLRRRVLWRWSKVGFLIWRAYRNYRGFGVI